MRFLHTADWHLAPDGAAASERQLERETLCRIIPELLIREKIPVLIIAGDVLQRTAGSSFEALALLEEALTIYSRRCNTTVILSAGNHDAKLQLTPSAKVLPGLHFAAQADYRLLPVTFWEGNDPISFYALPYLFPEQMRMQGFPEVMSHDDAYRLLLEPFKKERTDTIRVLAAHCMALTGLPEDPRTEQYRKSGEKVYADVFEPFCYTALGHLHSTEAVSDRIRYAPCPIPRGRAPEDGWISLVSINRSGVQVDNRRLDF